MAIRDQEELGIDIVGDGEMRRESYSNRLATALSGIDREKHGSAIDRTGNANPVPLVSGPIRRVAPIEAQDAAFLRRHSTKPVKLTLPGPFTMAQQRSEEHTSELQSLMRISNAVFCLKKKITQIQ